MTEKNNFSEVRKLLYLVGVAALCFLGYYAYSLMNISIVDKRADITMKCMTLGDQKKQMYFGQSLGRVRTSYNMNLHTCLVLNLTKTAGGDYEASLVDSLTDNVLYYYVLPVGQQVDGTYGLTLQQFVNKMKEYGFDIIS